MVLIKSFHFAERYKSGSFTSEMQTQLDWWLIWRDMQYGALKAEMERTEPKAMREYSGAQPFELFVRPRTQKTANEKTSNLPLAIGNFLLSI